MTALTTYTCDGCGTTAEERALTVGPDGALYGTTFLGAGGYGAVYRVVVQ